MRIFLMRVLVGGLPCAPGPCRHRMEELGRESLERNPVTDEGGSAPGLSSVHQQNYTSRFVLCLGDAMIRSLNDPGVKKSRHT